MFTQEKKTALVTGASSGMGKAIARRLIQDGYQVYVAARHVEKMADLASLGAQPLRMDISLDAEIVSGVETILAQTGGVDVLVNNAGFGLYGPVEEIDIEEARYQFEVNLFGAARLTQLLLLDEGQTLRAYCQYHFHGRKDVQHSGGLVPRN